MRYRSRPANAGQWGAKHPSSTSWIVVGLLLWLSPLLVLPIIPAALIELSVVANVAGRLGGRLRWSDCLCLEKPVTSVKPPIKKGKR